MINLLPDDTKRDILAARMNVILLNYILMVAAAVAVLFVICAFFYVILGVNQSSYQSKSNDNTSKAATFESVRKEADEYRNNLSIASKVLNNSVNYTDMIFAITKLLPDGVVLDSLDLNAANLGKQMTFSAHAKSYDKATALKESFQNSPLFSNVYFQSLTDNSTGQTTTGYPIAVVISAKLNTVKQQ